MSKLIFTKYLSLVKSKSVPKLKMLKVSVNLGFDISNMPISNLISKIILMKYFPAFRLKLVPKLTILKIS